MALLTGVALTAGCGPTTPSVTSRRGGPDAAADGLRPWDGGVLGATDWGTSGAGVPDDRSASGGGPPFISFGGTGGGGGGATGADAGRDTGSADWPTGGVADAGGRDAATGGRTGSSSTGGAGGAAINVSLGTGGGSAGGPASPTDGGPASNGGGSTTDAGPGAGLAQDGRPPPPDGSADVSGSGPIEAGAALDAGAAATSEPASGELRIAELLINPSGTDTGREWIEVVNRSARALTLAGLHVADASHDAQVTFVGNPAPALAPGARALLMQSNDPSKNGGVMLAAEVVGGTFGTLVSLNNDGDQISVCVGPCAAGVLITRVAWSANLGPAYDGHALVIDEAERLCPATLPFGDAGSFGTPGQPDPPCP